MKRKMRLLSVMLLIVVLSSVPLVGAMSDVEKNTNMGQDSTQGIGIAFIIGSITNLEVQGLTISFDAVSVSVYAIVIPGGFVTGHFSGERIEIIRPFMGLYTQSFICGFLLARNGIPPGPH